MCNAWKSSAEERQILQHSGARGNVAVILSMLSKPWGSLPYSIACCVIAAIAGCSKPASPHEAASSQPVDPCSLLTNDDIRSVQGEEIIDKKASGSTSGEFAISQCYFT